MIQQQIKHFRLGLGIFFLTFSGYYLPTYLQPKTVLAQPTANQNLGQNIEADRLFQEAEQLVGNEAQFINALTKYKQALRIYRQVGGTTRATATRQRLETILATSLPLAEKFEQEMDQDEAAFFRQFPKTENNQTANKLEELAAAQLGITLIGRFGRSGNSWTISESQNKAFEDIKEELTNYLNTQREIPTSSFFEVPQKLRDYLDQNTDKLRAIRTLVLENESPRWSTDMSWISEGDPSYPLPSYIGLLNLQKLFAIDTIYKQEQGKTKEVQEVLEASWKLTQSFKNDPSIIGQLVNIIAIRTQIGVIRKLDSVPTAWQERLLEHDYRQSILQALRGESINVKSGYRRFNKPETPLAEFDDYYLDLGLSEWSTSMRQNFIRWEAIAAYQRQTQLYKVVAQENVCTWNFDTWRSTTERTEGNLFGQDSYLSNWWTRAGRIMVDLELTQKILQMKEVGSSPQSIPNTQSTICPNANWVYQFTPNERRSITLAPLPWWAADVRGLPLIHTIDLNRN